MQLLMVNPCRAADRQHGLGHGVQQARGLAPREQGQPGLHRLQIHADEFSCQVYIGDLGEDATRRELEEAFDKYGYVKNIWIAKRPPGEKLDPRPRASYSVIQASHSS
jgi:hypothetical protein